MVEKEYKAEESDKIIKQYIENLLEAFCIEMVTQAKLNIQLNGHIKTGNLKNKIGWRKTGDLQYEVFSDAEYSGFIEYGTKSHEISAKVAKALHWIGDDGKDKFAKKVFVSGIKASPFMEPAYLETLRKAENNEL